MAGTDDINSVSSWGPGHMEPAKDAAVNLLQTISTEAFEAEMDAAQK